MCCVCVCVMCASIIFVKIVYSVFYYVIDRINRVIVVE